MTLVAIVAILDVVLIVVAFTLAFASRVGQRRECRRLRLMGAASMPTIGGRADEAAPRRVA